MADLNIGTRSKVIATATVLGVVGALAPQPALAQDPVEFAYELDFELPRNIYPGMTVEVFGQEMEVAALVDYQTMAEEDGVSLYEIVQRYHWQNDFAQVASRLADAYPDDFAGSAIVDQSSRGWIAFKGEVPAAARTLVADLAKPVTLIGHRGFSMNELTEASERHFDAVVEHPDVANAYGAPDYETGTTTIIAELRDGLSARQREHLLSHLQSDDKQPDNPHFNLVVRLGQVEFEQHHHYRGGAHGFFPGRNQWCTWGFTVIPTSGGGGHGLVTARHCDAANSATGRYHAHGSGSTGTLTKVRQAAYNHGDMAFYRTAGHLVDGNRFYYANGAHRAATAVARPTVGLRLCAYGRTSGNHCNLQVAELNVSGTVRGNTVNRLARTTTTRGLEGDSGGDWAPFGGPPAMRVLVAGW